MSEQPIAGVGPRGAAGSALYWGNRKQAAQQRRMDRIAAEALRIFATDVQQGQDSE